MLCECVFLSYFHVFWAIASSVMYSYGSSKTRKKFLYGSYFACYYFSLLLYMMTGTGIDWRCSVETWQRNTPPSTLPVDHSTSLPHLWMMAERSSSNIRLVHIFRVLIIAVYEEPLSVVLDYFHPSLMIHDTVISQFNCSEPFFECGGVLILNPHEWLGNLHLMCLSLLG